MPCSILVAMDESKSAQKALDYVRKNMDKEASVTLLSIVPDVSGACGMDSPSLTPLFKENQSAFCSVEDAKRAKLKETLDAAREKLVRAGFDPKKVIVRIRKKKSGIARDILKESSGGYDTLVLGRRGLTAVKEFFFGSVAYKVAHQAKGITVILVD